MSSGCTIQLDFFSVFLPCFCILILPLPLLGLGSKSTSLSTGFCVCRPRQYDKICWKLDLIFGFFVFYWLIVWVGRINRCGWCLAGGRENLESRAHSKCKLIISSFLTLPHLLDCFIFTKNAMSIIMHCIIRYY